MRQAVIYGQMKHIKILIKNSFVDLLEKGGKFITLGDFSFSAQVFSVEVLMKAMTKDNIMLSSS